MRHYDPWQSTNFPRRVVGTTKAPNYLSNFVTWRKQVSNACVMHVIEGNEGYENVGNWPHSLQLRTFCYDLLDSMPDEGLEETFATLSDQLEFYASQPQVTPALPQQTQVQGLVVGSTERPVFYVEEE